MASWQVGMTGNLVIMVAYLGISLAILALNVVLPILARRRYLQDEARRLRREKSK